MTAKVICMASAKGGSGKTVLTATIGAFLVDVGKKVLLIDTDAATNGLTLLYLKEVMLQGEYAYSEHREPRGIYESDETVLPEIVQLKTGASLIPATYKFINTEVSNLQVYKEAILSAIRHFRDNYDYIFLDAQAGSDPFAQIAMSRRVSDEVIIVSEYDPMSAAGVERLKGLLREDLTYVRTWVLLNKMLPDFVQSFSDFLEVAKYLSPIPWDSDVVRAYARRRLALDFDRGNEYTLAIFQTLKGLFDDEIAKELTLWAEKRAAMIRQPIAEQLADTILEVSSLSSERRKAIDEKERKLKDKLMAYFFIGLSGMLGSILTSLVFERLIYLWGGVGITLLTVIYASMLSFITYTKSHPTREMVYESEMQERNLKEKKMKLEVLATADLETLIKHNKQIQKQIDNIINN